MKQANRVAFVALFAFSVAGCSSSAPEPLYNTDTVEIVQEAPSGRYAAPTTTPEAEAATEAPSAATPAAPASPALSQALANCVALTNDAISIGADAGCETVETTHPQTFTSLFDRDIATSNCMWEAYSLDSEQYSEAYNLAFAEQACLESAVEASAPDTSTDGAAIPEGPQILQSCYAVTGGTITVDGESATCEELVATAAPHFVEIFDRDPVTAGCMWDAYTLDAEQYTPEYNLEWAQYACLE